MYSCHTTQNRLFLLEFIHLLMYRQQVQSRKKGKETGKNES